MSKVLAIKKEKNLAWGGAIPKSTSTQEIEVSKFCNQVAKIYGVPSMGVNAMGTQPYLNKDGRLYLLNELRKGKYAVKAIRTEYIQLSTSPDVAAIVKKIIVFFNGVEIEATGEASKDNVKLEAVKKTLNMMAETRAQNRAIWSAIAGDVWNRIAVNLGKAKDMTLEEKNRVIEAGRMSYEEATPEVVSDMFEIAKKKILVCKSQPVLEEYEKKIRSSKKYSVEQKASLTSLINAQADKI